ncbi:MAG: hypothetical protein ICV51_11070, partial [Flavisolibacter sp.]|nr:hypothetical protein [Flavisolibacter sp.]
MKVLVICISVLLLALSAQAQLGDIQLDNHAPTQRQWEKLPANPELKGTPPKVFFLGKNYRQEWVTPVSVPYLNFQTDFGGLTPLKRGGGKQTHSLYLQDSAGRNWGLRSIRKYPDKVLAPELQGTVAETIVKDAISSSYPYSALSVGTLSNAAKVPYLKNLLVYVPEDPLLDSFQADFAKAMYLLELRTMEENGKKIKILGPEQMVPELQKSNYNKVDQRAVLRARIFDHFIMDFDRHEGQYLWGVRDSGNRKLFFPIPRDRDQAFFNMDGFLHSLLKNMQALHPLQGLQPGIKHVATFNFAARNFDRAFLTEPDKATWNDEIDQLLFAMTDSVIEAALAKQPKEIQALNSQKIIDLLKKKREYLKKDLLAYYATLAKVVTILGSNEREQFTVTKNTDGTALVEVNKLDSANHPSFLIYQRLFRPEETREIQLYGLEGDDRFVIRGEGSKVRTRIVGGPGSDEIANEGKGGKTWAYDATFEKNSITGSRGIRSRFSADPMVNEYRRLGFDFNGASPGIAIDYASDGSFYVGLGHKVVIHGFRKEPYAFKQTIAVQRAVNAASFRLAYNADFIKLIKNEDLIVRADVMLPTGRTRFYGFGNNTPNQNSENNYYVAHYIKGDLAVLGRHHFTPWLQVQYGPILELLKLSEEKNGGKFIRTLYPVSPSGNNIYNHQWYAGGMIRADINTKNNKALPTRGIEWNAYAKRLAELNNSNDFT